MSCTDISVKIFIIFIFCDDYNINALNYATLD